MRVVRSVPEDQHADQDEDGGNDIPDKVHPMDALTAAVAQIFVLKIIIIHRTSLFGSSRMRTISEGVK